MSVFVSYLFALLATCLYLAVWGGRTGRQLAAVQLAMALISAYVSWNTFEVSLLPARMLAVDLVSLALKLAIAFSSTRRWPIWAAAFQFNTVLPQVAILASPAFRTEFYYALATAWALPTLFVLAAGLALDRRAERRLAS